MLKIGVIGAGHHSRTFHLPALAHYRSFHPNDVELAVICDRDPLRAESAASAFGFKHTCTDYQTIARVHKLDGCLILTPPSATLEAAAYLLRHTTMALLVEKPLGENPGQARAFLASLEPAPSRVMVSMNRRYDPGLLAAISWIGARKLDYLHVTMARVGRTEPEFMWTTGLHVIDAVLGLLGSPSTWSVESRKVRETIWNSLRLRCGETSVLIDFLPTAGQEIEHFEFFGADFTVSVHTGQVRDSGWRAWHSGRLDGGTTEPPDTPRFVADGTFAETEAFLGAIRGERAFHPTPAEVQVAGEICAELEPRISSLL